MARNAGSTRRSPASAPSPHPEIGDLRFRHLLSDAAWAELPPPIRRRFSKRVADGGTAIYVGEILETRMSLAGWLLAQASRLIGGPLPTRTDTGVPTVVTLTEDMATGGQIWTRLYARRGGFPQIIHSSKRFAGPTGLEEYLGFGLSMALRVSVEAGALVFRNESYLLAVGPWRIRLPAWATPGDLTVSHREAGDGRFVFTLDLEHPWAGTLIHQSAIYHEASP